MIEPDRTAVAQRLKRGIGARLLGGMLFQWALSFGLAIIPAVLIFTAIIAITSHIAWPFDGSDALSLLPGSPCAAIWLMGVTAHAEVDETGVSWRYYVRHAYAWDEIEEIEFGGTLLAAGQTPLRQPAIFVIAGGHRHKVAPAVGVSARHLSEFGHRLGLEAERHGISVGGSTVGLVAGTGQMQ
jgi:hypothetical protein